jgi:hypothetical protein
MLVNPALLSSAFGDRRLMSHLDEKSKMEVDTKQYVVTQGYKDQTAPSSPTNSMYSVINHLPSRQSTSQHVSPNHCLPTGMPNVEKPENIPEIQMPSFATLDPFYRLVDQDYASIPQLIMNVLLIE